MERVNSHVTDEQILLDRAKAYDPEALSELYDRYAPRMYAYIYRRVSDAALAEDMTSELFLRVLRAIRNEHVWRDSFTAWLYRIAHNLVIDVYRRRPPPSIPLDDMPSLSAEDDPADQVDEATGRERLQAAIHHLTPDQQQVLALRYGEGLTARETASIVHKTTGAVEALQRRALAALRRILTPEHSERETHRLERNRT
jgi:RNA polymerase sigma-70 factor (ECF subfamily)